MCARWLGYDVRGVTGFSECTATWLGGCCWRLVQCRWPVLVRLAFLRRVCAFKGLLLRVRLPLHAGLIIVSLCNTRSSVPQIIQGVQHMRP